MKSTIIIGIVWLLFIIVSPIASPHDPRTTNPERTIEPPSIIHFFGTDNLGRDVLSRTLHGGQRTILIAVSALIIATVPTIIMAIVYTITPKYIQSFFDIILNALLAFPPLLTALVILTLLGRGIVPIAIATGIAQLPFYWQFTNSILKQETIKPYVLTAKSLGASDIYIVWRHILPNAQPSLTAYASVTFAYCIINSAALSLLGLGGDPSVPDWGVMLSTGRDVFRIAPWVAIAPAVAISITIILVNRIVDTIR